MVAQPAINQQPPPLLSDVQQIPSTQPIEGNWQQDINITAVPLEFQAQPPVNYAGNYVPDAYPQVTKKILVILL